MQSADRIRALRAAGEHDAALRLALELVRSMPADAELQTGHQGNRPLDKRLWQSQNPCPS
jgi:hypothetical protein